MRSTYTLRIAPPVGVPQRVYDDDVATTTTKPIKEEGTVEKEEKSDDVTREESQRAIYKKFSEAMKVRGKGVLGWIRVPS